MSTAIAATRVRSLLYRCADPQGRSRWLDEQLGILAEAGITTHVLRLADDDPESCRHASHILADTVDLLRSRSADSHLARRPQALVMPDYERTSQRLQQWWDAQRREGEPHRCPARADMLTLLAEGHRVGIYVLATTAHVITPGQPRGHHQQPRPAATWWQRLRLQGATA